MDLKLNHYTLVTLSKAWNDIDTPLQRAICLIYSDEILMNKFKIGVHLRKLNNINK